MYKRKLLFFIVLLTFTLSGCQSVAHSAPSYSPPSVQAGFPSPIPSNEISTLTPQPAATKTIVIPPLFPSPTVNPHFHNSARIVYDRARGEFVAFGCDRNLPDSVCNETWVWNEVTWQQLQPHIVPFGRSEGGFAYDDARENAVLFDSPSPQGAVHNMLNDTWVWDGQNWQERHPATSPPARFGIPGNNLVYDAARQVVLLFGGEVPGATQMMGFSRLNDTWLWDGQTWNQAHPSTVPPALYEGVFMAYDPLSQTVLLLDGNTTWTWDGKTWAQQHPIHTPSASYGALGYDEKRQQMVFFCTCIEPSMGYGYFPETWVWAANDWQKMETSGKPLADSNSPFDLNMAYDTRRHALLLFTINSGSDAVTIWVWTGNDWQPAY